MQRVAAEALALLRTGDVAGCLATIERAFPEAGHKAASDCRALLRAAMLPSKARCAPARVA